MNKDDEPDEGNSGPSSQAAAQPSDDEYELQEGEDEQEDDEHDDEEQEDDEESAQKLLTARWQLFIEAVEALDDPLLSSIFKQGVAVACAQDGRLTVEFAKDFAFFSDVIQSTKKTWHGLLSKAFKKAVELDAHFVRPSQPSNQSAVSSATRVVEEKPVGQESVRAAKQISAVPAKQQPEPATRNGAANGYSKSGVSNAPWRKRIPQAPAEMRVDVSNKEQWKKVNLVLEYFPGTVTEVREHTA